MITYIPTKNDNIKRYTDFSLLPLTFSRANYRYKISFFNFNLFLGRFIIGKVLKPPKFSVVLGLVLKIENMHFELKANTVVQFTSKVVARTSLPKMQIKLRSHM